MSMLGARVFLSFIPFDLSSPSDMSVWKALFSFTHPTRRTVPKPESSFLAMTPEQRWPIPPEGTKNEAPSAPSPRERYTCEKESEVRSENDSEEEETHVHVVGSLDDQTENVHGVHRGKTMSSLELLVREDPFNDDVQVIARALATEDVNVGVLRVPHHLPLLLQSHRRNGP